MSPRRWDESDVRVRPNPRGSRPRSKQRPSHDDAVPGMVTAVDRGRYGVLTQTGIQLVAMRARELGRTPIVVGDDVRVVGDTSGNVDTLARIVAVADRSTVLRRSAEDTSSTERAVVANASQLLIVTALADPEPRPRMIDRCLVAAYDAGMRALLCLTKADLADPAQIERLYRPLDLPILATSWHPDGHIDGLEQLRAALTDEITVLIGHSGVGKSTLVNALCPSAERTIGNVNTVTGRGRHTSTSAVALPLPEGGWVIDTPGVRAFGLAHVHPDHVLAAFGDLAQAAQECPRGCTHDIDAPDCELDQWASTPDRRARLDSFRRLLASRSEPS